MSLRLLIDEDSQRKRLLAALRSAGFDVRTVNEDNLAGSPDAVVLAEAHQQDRAVLTRNAGDFANLHDSAAEHSGIIVIYQDHDRSKNMRPADIANALKNLEQSGLDIRGQLIPLNHWNY